MSLDDIIACIGEPADYIEHQIDFDLVRARIEENRSVFEAVAAFEEHRGHAATAWATAYQFSRKLTLTPNSRNAISLRLYEKGLRIDKGDPAIAWLVSQGRKWFSE